jgi:LysR family transcriptional regulator, benzoate and cis,cis-muconate-responsive activator of ben and cat genes
MELRHLRNFVIVAEEGNISRAARRLHVSQPPLSRQMRDLESELGFALLRRSARSIQLTEAGHVFLGEARAALLRVNDAVAFVRSFAHRKRNCLRVGHISTLAIELLPRALRTFQRSHPHTRIELRTMTTLQMTRALNCGELDMAITVNGESLDSPALDSGAACSANHDSLS